MALPNFDAIDDYDAQMHKRRITDNLIDPPFACVLYHYSDHAPGDYHAPGYYQLEKMTYFYAFDPALHGFERHMVKKHGKFKWKISVPSNIIDLRLLKAEEAPKQRHFVAHFDHWLRNTASDDSNLDNEFYKAVFAQLPPACNGVFMFANEGYSEYVLKEGVTVRIIEIEQCNGVVPPPVKHNALYHTFIDKIGR